MKTISIIYALWVSLNFRFVSLVLLVSWKLRTNVFHYSDNYSLTESDCYNTRLNTTQMIFFVPKHISIISFTIKIDNLSVCTNLLDPCMQKWIHNIQCEVNSFTLKYCFTIHIENNADYVVEKSLMLRFYIVNSLKLVSH